MKRSVYKIKSVKYALIYLNGIIAITNVVKSAERRFPMYDILRLKPVDSPKGLIFQINKL